MPKSETTGVDLQPQLFNEYKLLIFKEKKMFSTLK